MPARPMSPRDAAGFTLVELAVTITLLAVVMVIVTGVLLNSDRVHSRTVRRAEVQSGSRQALSLMTMELRQAGADPSFPPAGITRIVSATATSVRIRSDLNGNGTIETAEPSEDVTYSFNAGTRAIMRDPGTGAAMLAADVDSLRFSYYDADGDSLTTFPLSASDAALVHVIGITFTAEDRDSHPITLSTRVTLRNS